MVRRLILQYTDALIGHVFYVSLVCQPLLHFELLTVDRHFDSKW